MSKKEKLHAMASTEKDDTMAFVEQRIQNRDMLRASRKVALVVLSRLEELKWTKKELAEKLGVKPQQVSKIVRGSENLTLDTLTKLEKLLDVNLLAPKPLAQDIDYTAPVTREPVKRKMSFAHVGNYTFQGRLDRAWALSDVDTEYKISTYRDLPEVRIRIIDLSIFELSGITWSEEDSTSAHVGLDFFVHPDRNFVETSVYLELSQSKGELFEAMLTATFSLQDVDVISDQTEKPKLVLPEPFLRQMATTTLACLRGIIFSETAKWPKGSYQMPHIPIEDLVTGEIQIDL